MNVREICEFFWFIERKYGLLSDPRKQRQWAPFRFMLYYYITQKVGLFENPHPVSGKRKMSGFFFQFFKRNPFISHSHKSLALIPLLRRVNSEDIYSSEVLKIFNDKLDVIDQEASGSALSGSLLFDPFIHLGFLLVKVLRITRRRFFKVEMSEVNLWFSEFSHKFGVPLKEIQDIYLTNKIKFEVFGWIYFILFSIKRYKTVFLVGSYFQMYIVEAAKRAGSRVIELQHGVITPYHLGYSYPDQEENYFFPDELWCYGGFWSENTAMPRNAIFKILHPSFMKRLSDLGGVPIKKNKLAVFSSQGVVGTKIFEFALASAQLNPDYNIIFRLHPSEDLNKYQDLLASQTPFLENFKLSHKEPNIFLLMSQAEYVVGVFSTTIFEAIYLNAKIILLDMPGIEYMSAVISRNEATVIKTAKDFRAACENAKRVDPSYYYSESSSLDLGEL